MHATEIVKGKMQVDSSPKIPQFPRKRVRQSRETAKLHSYRQVLALHKTSRNVIGIRISAANFGYNLRDLSWGVAFIPLLTIISVELRKLREIGITAERRLDSLAVKDVGIGGQLDTMIGNSTPQFAHKELGVLAGTLANKERGNQFCVCVKGNVNPLIAEICRIVLADVPRFLHQEGPDFVTLQASAGHLAHFSFHQFLATFASNNEQTHDGVPVKTREPFGGANRAAFEKALQRTHRRIGIRRHQVSRQLFVRLTEGGMARLAAPTLNAALTEVAEFLAGLMLAFCAGHVSFPLFLSGMTCYHEIGSEVRVAPRFGLSGIHGSSREYRVYIYCYGGRISCLLFVIGPWILCWITPTNHGPFADLPAKSFFVTVESRIPATNRPPRHRLSSSFYPYRGSHCVTVFTVVSLPFLDISSDHHSLQHHLDSGLRIFVLGEIVPEALEFILEPTHLKKYSKVGGKKGADFSRQCGAFKQGSCFIARIDFYPLTLAKCRQCLNALANNNQPFADLLLFGKQISQFLFGRFVSFAVIGGPLHV